MEALHPLSACAKWFRLSNIGADGQRREFKFKAWVDNLSAVTWDGVLSIENIYGNKKTCNVISKCYREWKQRWDLFGQPPNYKYTPSLGSFRVFEKLPPHKQQMYPATDAGDVAAMKDVPQFGIGSMLSILCEQGAACRGQPRHRAIGSLRSICERFACTDEFRGKTNDVDYVTTIISNAQCSEEQLATDGLCGHLRSAPYVLTPYATGNFIDMFVDGLVGLHAAALECPRCCVVAKYFLEELVHQVDAAVIGDGDHNQQKNALPRGKRKRDEDVRHHLINNIVKQGKAASSSAAVRSEFGHKGTKQAWKWIRQDVKFQDNQSMIDFSHHGDEPLQYGCIKDATRLGNPAKDFQVCLLYRDRDKQTAWLLSQVVTVIW